MSSNPQCSFVSCARRNLEFNVTDSPIILPCDNLTSVNTNNTIGGNYSYCHNEELLVSQSTNYYTLELDISFNGATVCCYNHDIEACGICYNLIIYCKCVYMCIYCIVTCDFLRCSNRSGSH